MKGPLNFLVLLAATAACHSSSSSSSASVPTCAVKPQVKGNPQVVANLTDPAISRDSCVSVLVGDRAFWTCRDTRAYDVTAEAVRGLITPTTASWTNLTKSGSPEIVNTAPIGVGSNGSNPVLLMYGSNITGMPFYTITNEECPPRGFCRNGSRFTNWQGTAPMVTNTTSAGITTAYTFVSQNLVTNQTTTPSYQPTILYKLTFDNTSTVGTLPSVGVVNETFWNSVDIPYGRYGTLLKDDVAYLYAANLERDGVYLAKVSVSDIEDRSQYQFYVDNIWTSTMPSVNDTAALLPNAGTGRQGTFYYSEAFQTYIWIGQGKSFEAQFVLTTAPAPEGPWCEPYQIYLGAKGNGNFGAYALQANPALSAPSQKQVYLTWTMQFQEGPYITPLVLVEFE